MDLWNKLDVIQFAFIVFFMMVFYIMEYTDAKNTGLEETDDLLGLILMITRCVLQTLRIFFVLRNSQKAT